MALYRTLFGGCLIVIACILVIGTTSRIPLSAQTDQEPFFTSRDHPLFLPMYWSADDRYYTFYKFDWYSYDVQTGELNTHEQWPLQYEWTPDQIEQFEVGTSRQGNFSQAILSPNGWYVVYGGHKPENWFSSTQLPVGIANIQTGNYQVFLDAMIHPFSNFNSFTSLVYWSADSSSVVMITDGGFGVSGVYHLGNITDELSEIAVQSLDYCVQVDYNNDTVCASYIDLWDISSDGQKVLFSTNYSREGQSILVWDLEDGSRSRIIEDGEIINAAFYPDDDDKLLYISQNGLVEYNLVTDERRILDETLSLTPTDGASFSPNAEYLVIGIADPDVEEWNLYLKDLSEYID